MHKTRQVNTPPPSEDGSPFQERVIRGRAKVSYRRTKAYRKITTLSNDLHSTKCIVEKYKKRWLRLKLFVRDRQASCSSEQNISNCSTPSNVSEKYPTANHSSSNHGNALDTETKNMIETFLTRDDNSRMTTGKKQTVTKNKIKKQKRLLLDSLINLHEKFCAENPAHNISYVTFTRHRPFWVRQPTDKDRDTCICKKHENIQLAADKLYHLKVLTVKNIDYIYKQVGCSLTCIQLYPFA